MAGVFLIFVEIAYKKHRGLKEKELELAKTAADRWRGNIEVQLLIMHTHSRFSSCIFTVTSRFFKLFVLSLHSNCFMHCFMEQGDSFHTPGNGIFHHLCWTTTNGENACKIYKGRIFAAERLEPITFLV